MEGTLNDEDIDGNIQAIIDALAEINFANYVNFKRYIERVYRMVNPF